MRHLLMGLGLVATLAAAPSGARSEQTLNPYVTHWDFEQITIDNTAGGIGFTAAKITPSGKPPMTYAACRVRTAELSYLYVPPAQIAVTASVGQLLEPGDSIVFQKREDIVNFKAIRTGATSSQIDCLYKDQP